MPKANIAEQLMSVGRMLLCNECLQRMLRSLIQNLADDDNRTGEFNGFRERRGDDSQSPGVAIYLRVVFVSESVTNPGLFRILRIEDTLTVSIVNSKFILNFIEIKS